MKEEKSHIIDTSSLVDKVYEYLLNQIISGTVKYGDIINLKKLAETLNVSTMPVREAIKRLEFEQIVEIKPRSNCQVKMPSRTMIMEVYELREILETYAVTKSSGNIDKNKLKVLKGIVSDMKNLDKESDMNAKEKIAIELDRRFHSEICSLANNEFLNNFYRQLSLHVNMTLIHEKTFHKLEKQYPESHAEIVEYLEKNPKQAITMLKKHFDNVKDSLFNKDGQISSKK